MYLSLQGSGNTSTRNRGIVVGKKGLLLVFISDYKHDAEIQIYRAQKEDGTEWCFEGAQTNDAPVKYLISKAFENNNKIERIICIVSKKVKEQGLEEFKSMVYGYICSREELKAAYENQEIDFHLVIYPETEEEISVRATRVYTQLAASDCIGGETGARVYIDYTGGLRDINFLMTAIIRYLKYHGISCKEIVYSSYNRDDHSRNKIYSLNCIYDMYQLLNGVEQFVSTGNAELLQACYRDEGETIVDELLQQIVSFSHTMSLCDVRNVDKIMETLCERLDQFDAKEDKGSFFSVMLGDLTSIIRKKLYIEKGKGYSYPRLIQWCLDNNMVQQALTLYVEKMPEFYCNEGILKFCEEDAEKKVKNRGQSWRTEYFYGPFYDQFVMPELKKFGSRLKAAYNTMKETYVLLEKFEPERFRKLKEYMETDQEKNAVERLVMFLKIHYGATPSKILFPYTKERWDNAPRSANGFVNCMVSNEKWQIYFLYNNRKKYDESKTGTYEKKVLALDALKVYDGKIPNTETDDNALLYALMKYYLALKLLRNRINHASEKDVQEDEGKAIERLERNHGICMKIEFQNIKSLIQEGLKLYKNNPRKGEIQ